MTNYLGSFLFTLLFLARVDQGLRGSWIAWFLALQAALVAFRIMFRRSSKKDSPASIQWLAWLSALAPLAVVTPNSSEAAGVYPAILPLPGIALSVWSLIALGDSFSIAPSDRGLVRRGPYRIVRHPMYAGELLSLLGLCMSSPSFWNWSVLAVFALFIYMRIIEEESMIEGYYRYTRSVLWRLVPYVW